MGSEADAAQILHSWSRPRVKPEHAPFRIDHHRIRIGGTVYGIGSEITDPTGAVWALLCRLDGSTPLDRLVQATLGLDQASALNVLVQLAEAGHLEDAAAPVPTALTDRDRQRYDRSRQFHRWTDPRPRHNPWEPQLRLLRSRVLLVGLGGTGGTAALALAASGIGRLHCVDADQVELSNLNRQLLYTEQDIGRPKVDAALDRLRALNSDIEITGEQTRINGQPDLARLLARGRYDVLLLAADRPGQLRAWANRACLATGVSWVDSGYHGPRAAVGVYVPGQGACYECLWLAEHDRARALGSQREYDTARDGANAVTAPAAGISGHLAAQAVTALLTGVTPVRPGQVYGVNLVAPDDQYLIADPARPDCPACGPAA